MSTVRYTASSRWKAVSTRFDDLDEVEQKKLKNEQWAWWFSDFSRGPSTIVISFFFPAIIYLASNDGICDMFEGHTSGADGLQCTPDEDFNNTLWLSLNGSNCEVETTWETKFLHDPKLPGCVEALEDYRALMPYTCNCTGDYSFLDKLGGIRVGNLQSSQAVLNTLILAIFMPILGTYMDYTNKRKKQWAVWTVIDVCGSLLMAIMGPNYLWLVGMFFATVTHVSSDTLWVPISSYLGDVTNDETEKARLGGMRQFANFGAQCLFVVIMGVTGFMLGNVVLLGIIASIVDGLWLGFFMPFSLYYIRERKAAKQRGDRSLIDITLKETYEAMKALYWETPEAFKYMCGQVFAANGIATVIAVNVTYFQLEVGSSGFQIIIVSGVVLFAGIFCSYLFAVASKYFTLKQLWTFILSLWVFLGIITPLTMTRGANFLLIVAIGGVGYSFGLSWYFSIGFVAFESMAPADRRSQYTGIYTLATNLGSAIGPLVYSIIVQITNSQRLAICALPVFNLIALVIFRFVDFKKAKRDAHRDEVISQSPKKMAQKRRTTFAGGALGGMLEKMTSIVVPLTDKEVKEMGNKNKELDGEKKEEKEEEKQVKPPPIL